MDTGTGEARTMHMMESIELTNENRIHACSPKEVLDCGLNLLHCSRELICHLLGIQTTSTDEHFFETVYGSSPGVCARIWLDLLTTNIEKAHINPEEDGLHLGDFLLGCAFVKRYETLDVFEKIFGKSSTAISGVVWPILKKIQALKAKKND